MAIIEGTGIRAAGKEARAKALAKSKQVTSDKKIAAEYKVDPIDRMIRDIDRASKRLGSQESTGAVKETGRGMGDRFNPFTDRVDASDQIKKPNFFSPGGGIYDSRNEVKIASTDLSGLTSDEQTTSTFGTSFTKQADANIADASVYQKKEDNIYRSTDNVYDSIKFPKIEKDTGYGASLEKGIDNLDSFDRSFYDVDKATKEYGVPMSKEEKRVTTAYALTNPDESFKDAYKFSDTNYEKIKSDYAKYQNLRDRRQTRKEAEEAVTKFRSDYMKDFVDADYAIKMKQYNLDGTEKDINKYNQTLDQQLKDIKRVRTANEDYAPIEGKGLYALDRFGRVLPQSEVDAYNKKVDAEEAERIKLSKAKAKKDYEESQKNVLQKVGNFLGNVTNTVLGIQPAQGSQIGGALPSGTETPTTGDTSFSAYVRGGGAGQERGTTTPTAAPKQTVASLPSNYKATEAEAFRKAAAFKEAQKIAKRNPNVSVGVDSKGQPKATAAKDTGKAKAQAAAVNRKISGKSISSVKKANTAKMKAAAAARHAAFKKTGKSTASARKAAAKASVKAAAKKRHAAFKKRRAARRKSKKGKK